MRHRGLEGDVPGVPRFVHTLGGSLVLSKVD